jgi:hypothetical protein
METNRSTLDAGKAFKLSLAAAVFLVTFLIFRASPNRDMTDSHYAMLTSQTLFQYHTFNLDRYRWPNIRTVPRSGLGANTTVYQIESVNGHLFYYFPPGTSVLSVPYAALMKTLGISAGNEDGSYNPERELAIQGGLAAFLMAGATVIFFYLGSLALSTNWTVIVALAGALGTQVWSTASRVMWSDTWAIVLIAGAIWLLLNCETSRIWTRWSVSLLASLLAWSYFVRPTNSIAILAITIYILIFQRKVFPAFALTGAAWLGLFTLYSWHNFGQLLPNYFRPNRLHFGQYWEALSGNLISPSRGLLVFVPVLFFVVYLSLRFWKGLYLKRLAVLSLVIAVGHLLIVAAFVPWHGGGCFGPRYSTGLVPWFVLLAILGVRTMLDHKPSRTEYTTQLIVSGLLLASSVFINARGAISYETSLWNDSPVNIDFDARRVWDWRYPQFLAGLIRPPLPPDIPNINERATINLNAHDADKFLWYGWSGPEPDFRWTSAGEATVTFKLETPIDLLLNVKATPFLIPGKVERQGVRISVNGKLVSSLVLDEAKEYDFALRLSARDLKQLNVLSLSLPNAASPRSLGIGYDSRHLGLAVHSISFQRLEAGTR